MRCAMAGFVFVLLWCDGCGYAPAPPPSTSGPSQKQSTAPAVVERGQTRSGVSEKVGMAVSETKEEKIELPTELKEQSQRAFREGLGYFIWLEEKGRPIRLPSWADSDAHIRVNYVANPNAKPSDFACALWLVVARGETEPAEVLWDCRCSTPSVSEAVSAAQPVASTLLPYVTQWNRRPGHVWYFVDAGNSGEGQGQFRHTLKYKATSKGQGNLRACFFANSGWQAAYRDPTSVTPISNEVTVPLALE